MAVANYNRLQYMKAGVDLSNGYGLFVKMDVDGRAILATAADDPIWGVVIVPNAEDFELGVVAERGVLVPVQASSAIAVGDKVGVTAGGQAATATGAYVGVCAEAALAAGDVVTIMFLGLVSA